MAALTNGVPTVYRVAALAALFLAGCEPVTWLPRDDKPDVPKIETTTGAFGRITGRVTWAGPLPEVAPFLAIKGVGGTPETRAVSNPVAPRIDPASRGMGDVVVFLRGVRSSRPGAWRHSPAAVELTWERLTVNGRSVGFLPVGGEASFVTKETTLQMIRGRGDELFSYPLTEPDRPRTHRFDRPGHVELSSGAGHYWVRADLFVCDHPYYTRTDDRGFFEWTEVPPGDYDVVVWLRNWRPVRQDRNPESGLIGRTIFAEPVERVIRVTVAADQTATVDQTFDLSDIPHPATK